jgi:hypothetical protein
VASSTDTAGSPKTFASAWSAPTQRTKGSTRTVVNEPPFSTEHRGVCFCNDFKTGSKAPLLLWNDYGRSAEDAIAVVATRNGRCSE